MAFTQGKHETPYCIDSHVHLYPDAVAKKVTQPLAERFGNPPSFDGTVEGCVLKDCADHIAASINLPVATRAQSVEHTNHFWSAFTPYAYAHGDREISSGANGARVYSLASFHPLVEDKRRVLESIAQDHFTGIKFHPEYQQFRYNDSSMDEVWRIMADLGLVAYFHAGGERVFKPPYRSSPAEIARLQERFASLRIVAAHLGGFGMWDETEREIVGSTVYLDLSHTFFWAEKEQIRRIIENHGAGRILFGTDAPWQDPGKVLAEFLSLDLDATSREAILWRNAARLFSLPVDGTRE